MRLEKGPKLLFPGAYDHVSRIKEAITLTELEYVRFEDDETGIVRVQRGECVTYVEPTEKVIGGGKKSAAQLNAVQYVVITDGRTGIMRTVPGPQIVFPDAYDVMSDVRPAVVLNHREYIRLLDTETGRVRCIRGEGVVFPEPHEVFFDKGGKMQAVEVDRETAVLVRNTLTGQLRLETHNQLFVPSTVEEIVTVQKLIRVMPYETVIVKDREGTFCYLRPGREVDPALKPYVRVCDTEEETGSTPDAAATKGETETKTGEVEVARGMAFFLPPYYTRVTLLWSDGPKKDQRTLRKESIDHRPFFMNYTVTARTSDNVELTLDLIFFVSIDSVDRLMMHTDDATGDIAHHARSRCISRVSQVTMEQFMVAFNAIIQDAIITEDDDFYSRRGCIIHAVELRHFQCKDPSIEGVLQQIISETTNRMNRLQVQESENEVKLFKMKGDIEQEKLKSELIEVRHAHVRAERLMEGEAEADRVKAFVDGMLDSCDGSLDRVMELFGVMRKCDMLEMLSKGPAHLYFTPRDVDLRISTTAIGDSGDKAISVDRKPPAHGVRRAMPVPTGPAAPAVASTGSPKRG
jgi:hypothetical protein